MTEDAAPGHAVVTRHGEGGAHSAPGSPRGHVGDGSPGDEAPPADPAGPAGPAGPGDGAQPGRPVPAPGRKQRSFWKELPLLVGIALILALLIKTFLVQAFSIPSDSMQNTLQQGDRVLVDKLTPWFGSEPSRGEVVVFHDPGGWLPENPPTSANPLVRGLQTGLSFVGLMPSADEKDLIKRVIGVGGDTVECDGPGPLKVNGRALDEPYVYPGDTACSTQVSFKITVPEGRIWVMGDHRQNSLDSRFHRELPGGGTVADRDVVGRAIVVAWPVNRWDTLSIPATFSQPGINVISAGVPSAAGLAGALPLVLMRRRRLLRKAEGNGGAGVGAVAGVVAGAGAVVGGRAEPVGGDETAAEG
ncbi:signal peptidase I [Streptomyces sp.]|uniref:signal peptidase I n=1 Tax=Streptomyces sp. TaxID=1931 RepID=UPI002F4046FE